MAYTKYSLTPANNNAAPPDGAPEGMLPSAVNDTMRDMMAQIRDVGDGIRGGTYTMTAPVITGGTITGVALTGNTFTSPVISGGSINNTPIGATTANTGAFSTLSATGVTTVQAGTVSAPAITTTGDTNTGIFFPAADTIAFTEGGVESMRIDSSGNVGIGATPTQKLDVFGSDNNNLIISRNSNNTSSLRFQSNAAAGYIVSAGAIPLIVDVNGSERMRIDSSGNLLVGTTAASVYKTRIVGSAGTLVQFEQSSASNNGLEISINSNNTTQKALLVYSTSSGLDNAYIFTNGDIVNRNNSYGAISDVKLKENIVDATPKLEDLCKVKVRQYNLISEPDHKQLGVIAQELEQVFPSMIDESPDTNREGKDLGTTTKSVKYSVFVPMLIKAIQEQQTLINNLTTRLNALEGK
jgi:hypothetical protein